MNRKSGLIHLRVSTVYDNQIRYLPLFVLESAGEQFSETADIVVLAYAQLELAILVFSKHSILHYNHHTYGMCTRNMRHIVSLYPESPWLTVSPRAAQQP